jgi:hypothetical protein
MACPAPNNLRNNQTNQHPLYDFRSPLQGHADVGSGFGFDFFTLIRPGKLEPYEAALFLTYIY